MRNVNNSQEVGTSAPDSLSASGPNYVVCESMLCRLLVWSESQWAAQSEFERPLRSEYVSGLGWIVAIPLHGLN